MRTFLQSMVIILICCAVTFDACQDSPVKPTGTTTGTAGSMARFTIADHYLYTVDNTTLRIFDINSDSAVLVNSLSSGVAIETIFTRGNTLFLGANSGVSIYDITSRDNPIFLSKYQHIISCDPVVADAEYAYSTLRTSGGSCNRGTNVLDIIDITDLKRPTLVFSIPMDNPKGLGLVGDTSLVVCDNGLKLINIANRKKPILLHNYRAESMIDIIPYINGFTALTTNGMSNFTIANDSLHLIGRLEYK